MPYSYEENDDLHGCCAVNCGKPGTELLIMKSWTGIRYGGKEARPIILLLVALIAKIIYLRS